MVEKAGQLLLSRINELALCAVYSETSALVPLTGGNVEHKEKVFESPCRFSTKLVGVSSLEVKEVMFSVNKAVSIHGYSVYCGADMSRKYKITLQKVWSLVSGNVIRGGGGWKCVDGWVRKELGSSGEGACMVG